MVKRKSSDGAGLGGPLGPDHELARLIERDLTALCREGKLPSAHGVEPLVGELVALVSRGDKHPLLAGEPGVGKTAAVQELARRLCAGEGGPELTSARVVEVSLAGV